MLSIMYKQVAGLDVHKKTVVATRMQVTTEGRGVWETQTFGTTTPDLLQLHDWLCEWPCSHVALESTGDYWKPVYNVLEGTFEVVVVNANHVKHVPGRKTDVKDSEWLAELMMHGLLKASFVPPQASACVADTDPLSHDPGSGTGAGGQPSPEVAGGSEHQTGIGCHQHPRGIGAGYSG